MAGRLLAAPPWARGSEQVCAWPDRPLAHLLAGLGSVPSRDTGVAPMAETQAWPATLPAGRLWPQLLWWREQARLNGREARAPMKRPFMATQRPSVSSGAWPRGPVVRVSVKQTYLPKGRAAGGSGAGAGAGRGSPQCPGLWQGHKAPTSGFSGHIGGVTGCAHTSPCPPTVFYPHIAPPPAFHTYPSGSQPPHLPSCQPLCLALLAPPSPLLRWGLQWGTPRRSAPVPGSPQG